MPPAISLVLYTCTMCKLWKDFRKKNRAKLSVYNGGSGHEASEENVVRYVYYVIKQI
jgi:hypothetical protein